MADLTDRLVAAALAEIERQIEGKPGPWITDWDGGVWFIGGKVNVRRLVEAVASEVVAALHEPSEAMQAAWRLMLDRAAREHGLGAPYGRLDADPAAGDGTCARTGRVP